MRKRQESPMKIQFRNRTLRLVATAAALMAGTAGVA